MLQSSALPLLNLGLYIKNNCSFQSCLPLSHPHYIVCTWDTFPPWIFSFAKESWHKMVIFKLSKLFNTLLKTYTSFYNLINSFLYAFKNPTNNSTDNSIKFGVNGHDRHMCFGAYRPDTPFWRHLVECYSAE